MLKIDIFNHVLPVRFFEKIGDFKDIGSACAACRCCSTSTCA